jgi:hypothetical protein
MSHFTVLLGHHTIDDGWDIIKENYEDPSNEYDPMPFGFDYMCEIKTYLPKDIIEEEKSIGEIIDSDGEELWWCNGIGSPKPKLSFKEAMEKVKKNEFLTLYDTHL